VIAISKKSQNAKIPKLPKAKIANRQNRDGKIRNWKIRNRDIAGLWPCGRPNFPKIEGLKIGISARGKKSRAFCAGE
jgi:hypothetical protein